jgi:hypothetical protein
MAQYRFLVDHYIGGYYSAGDTATTADVGGSLPANWKPTGGCDPLDTPAVNAFYAAGPQATPLIRTQWSTIFVAAPATYWKGTSLPPAPGTGVSPLTSYQLTGLGTNMPPIHATPIVYP